MHIAIINGPNLNLVGVREPDIYGSISFDEYIPQLQKEYEDHEISYFQSNHEGAIIDEIQRIGFEVDAIIINAAAYTHTSIAIADALRAISARIVEVHISDISQRELYRQHSFITPVSEHMICGEGIAGYAMAIEYLQSNPN